ncbi:MAG: GNAT family N-acetyltransferase [Pseudomonadota bacterium]|nr:GNAT family N-acetyltransferase [Pseudomonadota bacterium]
MTGFRDAKPDDAELLADLGRRSFVETFGHLYSADNLAAFLRNHSADKWRAEIRDPAFAIRIAEQDGVAIAYAKVGPPSLPFAPERPSTELRQFYVLKRWQGKGVAQTLMQWVIEEARRRGADDLYLSVFTDNHRARRFYENYGFTFVRTYDFMVGTHADEDQILRLRLEDAR